MPHVVAGDELALWHAIGEQLPIIGAWVVSFLFVLVFWVAHHYFFDHLKLVDRGLLWLNGLFLLAISFTPFPTALSGQYPGTRPATFMLSAAMFVTASLFSLMRWYVAKHPQLQGVPNVDQANAALRRGLASPCLYLLAVAASFFYPIVSIGIQVIVPVIFFFPGKAGETDGTI